MLGYAYAFICNSNILIGVFEAQSLDSFVAVVVMLFFVCLEQAKVNSYDELGMYLDEMTA